MEEQLIKLEPPIYNIVNILNRLGHRCLLVGGAVRDSILGIVEPKDIDIEVYKISYDDLMNFLSKYGKVDLVGKKFGVIVFNPTNGNGMKYDFSIPRKESKVGVGHTEFEITFDENFTIEEAASRRDITINALAYDPIENKIYDYYGGLDDIKNKIIRHTSDKFDEDYLRILRIFQMQSRFGFEIHPDTIALMKKMLTDNPSEFLELSVERICIEWEKWASKGVRHDLIFKFMRDTGLIEYYPVLKALKETQQDEIWHPEGDVEIHTELCLKQIDRIIAENNITGDEKTILVLSVLQHDIGKPKTTVEEMKNGRMAITSNGHEALGGKMSVEFLESIGVHESIYTPIANIVANHLAGVNISLITAPSGKMKAVKKLSRRLHPASIQQLLWIMEADTNGRGWLEHREPTGSREIAEIAKDLDVVTKQYQYILMGRHLIEIGMKPSEEFGVILRASYEAQEEGVFHDVEGAKKWLDEYLNKETCSSCGKEMDESEHNYGTEDILCCIHCYNDAQNNIMEKDEANYGEPVTIEELEKHYKSPFLTPEQFTELVRACVDNEIKKSKPPVDDLSFFKTFMSVPKDFKNLDANSKSIYHSIVDWLRDKHGVEFYIVPMPIIGDKNILINIEGYRYNFYNKIGDDYTVIHNTPSERFDTHYEALHNAIEEGLKLIQKQK